VVRSSAGLLQHPVALGPIHAALPPWLGSSGDFRWGLTALLRMQLMADHQTLSAFMLHQSPTHAVSVDQEQTNGRTPGSPVPGGGGTCRLRCLLFRSSFTRLPSPCVAALLDHSHSHSTQELMGAEPPVTLVRSRIELPDIPSRVCARGDASEWHT
jgi:hypothetical protein